MLLFPVCEPQTKALERMRFLNLLTCGLITAGESSGSIRNNKFSDKLIAIGNYYEIVQASR